MNSFFSFLPSIVEKSKDGFTKISDSFIHSFPEFLNSVLFISSKNDFFTFFEKLSITAVIFSATSSHAESSDSQFSIGFPSVGTA